VNASLPSKSPLFFVFFSANNYVMSGVVELPGYSGPHVRPVFVACPPIVPQGAGQGPNVAQLNACIKELEEANMATAQTTAELQARVISAEDVAKQFQLHDTGGSTSEAVAAALAVRAQMGLSTEAGALSSRQGFEMGKVLLSFSQVFTENSIASKLSHMLILPSVCGRLGGQSVKEIKPLVP
jgi:PAB1-binding protein PBP1